ncbi:conserved hypothetical protein [Bradyrhizobium sp. STM 3809]|nr:conserved hypothetical protein [Bradyrhizobium sp. STM 3809]
MAHPTNPAPAATASRPRGGRRPSLADDIALDIIERARGMPGEGLTHGPPAEKKQAAVTTGSAGHSGIPRAMALRLIRGLPGAPAVWPPSVGARRALDLDTSFGVSGHHDFAVRAGSFVGMISSRCDRRAHRIPPSTFVTIAKRPSHEDGTVLHGTISDFWKQPYSQRHGRSG